MQRKRNGYKENTQEAEQTRRPRHAEVVIHSGRKPAGAKVSEWRSRSTRTVAKKGKEKTHSGNPAPKLLLMKSFPARTLAAYSGYASPR